APLYGTRRWLHAQGTKRRVGSDIVVVIAAEILIGQIRLGIDALIRIGRGTGVAQIGAAAVVIDIDDGLAEPGLDRGAREKAAAPMRPEQRLDALEKQRTAGDPGGSRCRLAQEAGTGARHQAGRGIGYRRRGAAWRSIAAGRRCPLRWHRPRRPGTGRGDAAAA